MTPDFIAARTIIRERALEDAERLAKRSARRWRLMRLVAVLAILAALLWAFYAIGYQAGLIDACFP